MEQQLIEIREQQKATWNRFSPGWKKWDELSMEFLQPMGDAIIKQLNLNDNHSVLDIAAGTGEPGLTIAHVVKNGKVVITDLANDMLAVARQKAIDRRITNVEFAVCDVCELPFAENSFDAISCRFGFMFFPDMLLAATEMYRVLRPGGKISTTVWNGPENNFWVTATMGPVNKNMQLTPPPPGSPGIFRCAAEGMIADLFAQVGLKNISQQQVTSYMKCGTVDNYWNFTTDVVAPVVAALAKADDATKKKIKEDVYHAVNQKFPDGNVIISSSATVITAEKQT